MTLRSLHLHPYKVHSDLNLKELPSICVFVGPNNSGKSAVLHAAALPKYGVRWDAALPTAPVDDATTIGKPVARVELNFGSEPLGIEFSTQGDGLLQWNLKRGGTNRASSFQIPGAGQAFGPYTLLGVTAEDQRIFYLGAYRVAPRRSFQYQEFDRDIGPSGEECWNAIHNLKADDSPIFGQVQTVMSELGFQVRSVRTPTAAAGSGSIRLENYGRSDSLPFIGSGANSVLPVVTQGALCESGETFLIEEPELHLHESAITGLGNFLGKIAMRGVQVIMTTHSTALFGPMYLAAREGRAPRDVAVFVFDRNQGGATSVSRIPLEEYHGALNRANAALRTPAGAAQS